MTLQPLVDLARERGGLGPDDLVACLAPLFRQVMAAHEQELVAPLRGIDALAADERYRVGFDPADARPPLPARSRVADVQRAGARDARGAVEIVGRSDQTYDTGTGTATQRSLDVLHPPLGDGDVVRPVLVSGWQTLGAPSSATTTSSPTSPAWACCWSRWPAGSTSADVADAERLAAAPRPPVRHRARACTR